MNNYFLQFSSRHQARYQDDMPEGHCVLRTAAKRICSRQKRKRAAVLTTAARLYI